MGNANPINALALSITLVALSLVVSAVMLPPVVSAIIVTYLALNLAYSFVFKNKMLLEHPGFGRLLHACEFSRAVCASDVPVSRWFLAFSSFFFLGLACLKRFVEIKKMKFKSLESVGRDYCMDDLEVIQSAGMQAAG